MLFNRHIAISMMLLVALLMTGCASHKARNSYVAFKQSRPASILVLPPLNESPDVKATYGMLSQATRPLAESGYYVFPVALVDETFKQNGITNAHDAFAVPPQKLREIFGADAALYITVQRYGVTYLVLSSDIIVQASAKLVDLKTGTQLWAGKAYVAQGRNVGGGDIITSLVIAAVDQAINTASDATFEVAGAASERLLSARSRRGILYGPRSPFYMKEGAPAAK